MRFISFLLLYMCACVVCAECSRPWFVFQIVLVPYVVGAGGGCGRCGWLWLVRAVVAVTDMCAVVYVGCEYAERLCGCEGDSNADVGDGGVVVEVNAGHEYVGGTRVSGIVSSAADELEMCVGRGMKGVGGVCEMCMCLARGCVACEGGG